MMKIIRRWRAGGSAELHPLRQREGVLDVFVHVPKTGGSCVRTVLAQNYDLDEMRSFDGPVEDLDRFKAGDGTFTRRVRLLYGHVPLGVEDGLDASDFRRVTMLREPVSRLVSDYLFAMTPESGYYDEVMSGALSFLDFVADPRLRNAQASWIAGIHPLSDATVTDEHLAELSRAALDRYAVVGINEHLPETMLLFAKALGWKPPVYKSVNVSPMSKRFMASLTERTLRHVRDLNKVDVALYAAARDSFRERLSTLPPVFWKGVEEIVLAADRNDADRGAENLKATFVLGRDRLAEHAVDMPSCRQFISNR
jgi:hypothetical protein